MPDINGDSSANDIDVTNDNGTMDGTPQGTPIDNVNARGGDDTVDVTDSTLSGSVRGGGGEDAITITDSTISGGVMGDSGVDDITVSGSTISGRLDGGRGDDTLNVSDTSIGLIRLGSGDDTLNLVNVEVTGGDVRGGGGSDTMNLAAGTVVNDDTYGTFTVALGVNYNLSSGTFTMPSGAVITYRSMEDGTGIPCFTRGTLIDAGQREVKIEQLRVGDRIPTASHGQQVIRWIGSRRFGAEDLARNPKLRPVRIMAGALGNGLPRRDLLVSRQHRMLVSSKIAERMFGATEVLIAAIKLTELPGIYLDEAVEEVEYFHLLCDRHEVIFAEGAPTESLYTGPEAMRAVSPAAQEEISAIFPELANPGYVSEPARPFPSGREQKRLIARHVKNEKPLLGNLVGSDVQ